MAEPAASESSPETDREFEPSADLMVHEYDDEQTLDEEEALSGESCSNELEDLEKEGDMPIGDLLAMYGYNNAGPPSHLEPQDTRSSSEEEILSNQDLTLDKEEIARDLLKDDDEHNKETTVNDLLVCVNDIPSQTSRLLRSHIQAGSSDDEDSEDGDYQPVKDDDWKKMISVGTDFQAVVPDGLCQYGDAPAYENEDRLLWDPNKMNDIEVEKYLADVHKQNQSSSQGVQAIPIPTNTHTRDDEQALYLLLQCGHNMEEALRRRKMQAVPPTDPMSLWSEEECRNFENGLRVYGKDFYLIQQNKVRTRSVGELIQFYYLWKKTERHDVFANKTRLEKKKYALHPGVTDYMDRFLDEHESAPTGPVRERSNSPSISSLIYGDPKRQSIELEAALEMVQKVVGTNNPVFSPLKLHPDLNHGHHVDTRNNASHAAATKASLSNATSRDPHPLVSLGPAAPQSKENTVHIANFTNKVTEELTNGLIEPSPKRAKPSELENGDDRREKRAEKRKINDKDEGLEAKREKKEEKKSGENKQTENVSSDTCIPCPNTSEKCSNVNSTSLSSSVNTSSSSPSTENSPAPSSHPSQKDMPTLNHVENGSLHVNSVEVSVTSVSNSLMDSNNPASSIHPNSSLSSSSTDNLPTRTPEPVAQ